MSYTFQQTTSNETAEITQWFHQANRCETSEERRYCYLRILEIDPAHVVAKQGMLDLGNGPARQPVSLQSVAPVIIIEKPRIKQYPIEDAKTPIIINISERSVVLLSAVFLVVCVLIGVLHYVK